MITRKQVQLLILLALFIACNGWFWLVIQEPLSALLHPNGEAATNEHNWFIGNYEVNYYKNLMYKIIYLSDVMSVAMIGIGFNWLSYHTFLYLVRIG